MLLDCKTVYFSHDYRLLINAWEDYPAITMFRAVFLNSTATAFPPKVQADWIKIASMAHCVMPTLCDKKECG